MIRLVCLNSIVELINNIHGNEPCANPRFTIEREKIRGCWSTITVVCACGRRATVSQTNFSTA